MDNLDTSDISDAKDALKLAICLLDIERLWDAEMEAQKAIDCLFKIQLRKNRAKHTAVIAALKQS